MTARSSAVSDVQLDLFADIDAEHAANAAAEAQRHFEEAPSIFHSPARGYAARVAAFEAWAGAYGHFGCFNRSHAWHAAGGSSVTEQPTSRCRPTTLEADLRCDHFDDDCCCIGELLHRGACLGCSWEGPIGDEHNDAVEDAHDHAWPGWRELPTAPRRPEPGRSAPQRAAMYRWVEAVNDVYPAGWLQAGGPIRTLRGKFATRHVPHHSGFGGYDLAVPAPAAAGTAR